LRHTFLEANRRPQQERKSQSGKPAAEQTAEPGICTRRSIGELWIMPAEQL
jgi:hypothetical protein